MTYAEKLKHPKWQKKRLEILQRDNFKCRYCGDEETTLNIHHLKYNGKNPWEISNDFLITTCEHCHTIIEISKKVKLEVNNIIKRYVTRRNLNKEIEYVFVSKCGIIAVFKLIDNKIIFHYEITTESIKRLLNIR